MIDARTVRAALLALLLVLFGAAHAEAAAGVPSAPTTVFLEDFENVSGDQLLNAYTGAAPLAMTYSVNPVFVDATQCTGVIIKSGASRLCPDGASATFEALADQFVTVHLASSGNHALSSLVHFDGSSPIAVTSGHFYTVALDAAVINCENAHPDYQPYLFETGVYRPLTSSPINPCTAPGTAPGLATGTGVGAAHPRAGRYYADLARLITATQVTMGVDNSSDTSSSAIDNVRLVDVTPKLDHAFSLSTAPANQIFKLKLTVTNTKDLAAKGGWSATESLPAGLEVAPTPFPDIACQDSSGTPMPYSQVTATATTQSTSVGISGSLDAGDASCSVTVNVKATGGAPGTYKMSPSSMTASAGLLEPSRQTTVTLVGPPTAKLTSPSAGQAYALDSQAVAHFSCTAVDGGSAVSSCTAQVTEPGGSTATVVDGGELPTSAPGTYSLTVTGTDADGQQGTATGAYVVSGPPVPTIDAPLMGRQVAPFSLITVTFGCAGASPVTCTSRVVGPGASEDDEDGLDVPVANGDALPTTTPGTYAVVTTAEDALGQTATTQRTYEVVAPPTATITGPTEGLKLAQGDSVESAAECTGLNTTCTTTVEQPDKTVVTLADGDPLPATQTGTYTVTVEAVDAIGQRANTTRTYQVAPRPEIAIAQPVDGAVVAPDAELNAQFTCAADAGIDSCIGSTPNGTKLDTSSPGARKLTVTATDTLGQRMTKSVTYVVQARPDSGTDAATGTGAAGAVVKGAARKLALQCAKTPLVLLDVRRHGNRVTITGQARQKAAGHKVSIRLLPTNAVVAAAVVRRDGGFTVSAGLPNAAIRRSKKVGYRAELGTDHSKAMKLVRRIDIAGAQLKTAGVLLTGHVTRPLARPVAPVIVTQRISCTSPPVKVGQVTPRPDGRFSIVVERPYVAVPVLYQVQTQVRSTERSAKMHTEYSVVRGVDVTAS